MNVVSILIGFFSVMGSWFIFQALSVNYALGFLYLLAIAVFTGISYIQHYDSSVEFHIKNRYTWLNLSAVIFITGLIIVLSGHLLM
jgi:hypothetical protein